MASGLTRREFLVGAGCTIAGLAAYFIGKAAYQAGPGKSSGQLLFEQFPAEVPGAKKVEKYPWKNADVTLVHVAQSHNTLKDGPGLESALDDPKLREEWTKHVRDVNACQRDVLRILEFLEKNYGVKETYSESVIVESPLTTKQDAQRLYAWRLSLLDRMRVFDFDVADTYNELLQLDIKKAQKAATINDSIRFNELMDRAEQFKYYVGADLLLAHVGRITMLPAETKAAWDEAQRLGGPATADLRENIAIDLASQGNGLMRVVVYGGAHNFVDNLERWNAKNPSRAMHCIVITPTSLI